MNLVDILIWLTLAGFIVKGFMKGLVQQVCSLLGLLVGGWAALKYYAYVTEASRHLIHLPAMVATAISFVCIFLVVSLLFYFLGHLLTVMFKIMLLGGVNRVGGVVLGLLEGAFILCLVLYLGTTKPVPDKLKGYLARSRTAQPFIVSGREIITGWDGSPPVHHSPGKQ
ncbi:MAG TPA: CvpA family protein [Geobacteraceae bacterium]